MNKKLLLEQKSLVDSFLRKEPRLLSCFSFVYLWAWADFFDFEFQMINDRLCIFAYQSKDCFLYLPPLGGDMDSSTIDQCFDYMASTSRHTGINRIENIPENLLACFPLDRYNHAIKPAEYVYCKEDLIRLKGTTYKSQRHDCNHFLKHQKVHAFTPYTDQDESACRELYACWAKERLETHADPIYRSMIEENRQVHMRLLTHRQDLGLVVRLLKIDAQLAGYTFGYKLNDSVFCVYAEIANLKIPGAAAYMFHRFCADEQLKDFDLINTMDDFAMPNVAQAKKSYHPVDLVHSYTISLKR